LRIDADHADSNRGFTLLELLVVCLLISISLAFSVPTLRGALVTDKLAAGARKLISLIGSGRSKAVISQEAQVVLFDLAEQKVWYQTAAERDDEGDEQTGKGSSVTLPEGVRIDAIKQATGSSEHNPAADGLWVSKQGYMDETTIRLVDAKHRSMTLRIFPFIFKIRIDDSPDGF